MSSGVRAEVEALMRRFHGNIKDALPSKYLGDFRGDWRGERTAPFAFGAESFEGLFFFFLVLFDLLVVFRARRSVAFGNLKNRSRIAFALNRNFFRERDCLSGGRFTLELHWIRAGFGFK